MRFRKFSETATSASYLSKWYWPSRGRSAFDRTDIVYRSASSHQMLDVVTPNFLRERNKGSIICSPMLHEKIYSDIDHTVVHAEGTDYGLPLVYDLHTPYGLSEQSVSSVCDELKMWPEFEKFESFIALATTRAHANVNISEMNVLASLGEVPETIRWIQSIVKRVLKLTKALQRKSEILNIVSELRKAAKDSASNQDFSRLQTYMSRLVRDRGKPRSSGSTTRVADTLLNLWLEYRYAVRPLIGDLQNAIKALDRILQDERFTARGREYHTGEAWKTDVLPYASCPDGLDVGVTVRTHSTDLIKARAGCLYVLDAELASMLDVLGLDQPLEAIWELSPYSFILDWVFSIGDLLESWFKSSGLSILTSWVTLQVEHTEERRIIDAKKASSNPKIIFSGQQLVLGSSNVTVQRKWRLPNPPLPLLPRFDLKLDLAKIIDLGAIGRAAIGGKVPEVTRRV